MEVYSKKDFILPKKEFDSGCCFALHELEKSFKSCFCLEFRLTGVSNLTWQRRSPEPLYLIAGMPLPRSLKSFEVWVPEGILILSLPSKVGTSIESPFKWQNITYTTEGISTFVNCVRLGRGQENNPQRCRGAQGLARTNYDYNVIILSYLIMEKALHWP